MSEPRYRETALGRWSCHVETAADGAIYMRPNQGLEAYPERLLDRLIDGAQAYPDRSLVARRDADEAWRHVSYGEMLDRVRRIASALRERDLSAERPLLILSENSIEHLVLAFGAMYAGIPHCPLSPAASLRSSDYFKVAHAMRLLTPGLVFADDLNAYAPAIAATVDADTEVVGVRGTLESRAHTDFAELERHPAADDIDEVHAATGPDTVAKFLFTSGSTSLPKAVTTTQRMLCSNQQMLLQTFPFMAETPPVLVDWLPWNHTFGGSHNVGIVVYNGGTLYIDEGKPTPALFGETLRNLREISPTLYLNVPGCWEKLTRALETEPDLRRVFYKRLELKFFAAAGLAQSVWDRLDAIAEQECGERIPFMSGLGATETAPSAMFTTGGDLRAGAVGLPCPGSTLKLVPIEDQRYEARFAGPHVMPGYWRNADKSAEAFDDEQFYSSGDALEFADPHVPNRGLFFAGRIAENFKLSSGSFVATGALRGRVLGVAAPYFQDVVITGADRADIGLLIFADAQACQELADTRQAMNEEQLAACASIQRHFAELIAQVNRQATGSATRIARACILAEPPSFDAQEVTDKGSINQRRVLARRAELVDALHEDSAPHQLSID
ncbi:feruloyl-CoA synthase [Salinisphaera orenii MK-B5]|uniref:Feruloyl-CoA synthase n=1 Tax=Salinisphaera orenii MK-B5 TaxID=856730 RepID=A0A423PPX6_9GAMM|nr:feruloyl-CoA synthase [Salinisphaera orenii]ROO27608.1 feruloyl-CoA synthase [Salinisphaera orenii MK-B5]